MTDDNTTTTAAKILRAMPGTRAELVASAGCSPTCVRLTLQQLCADERAHISGWVKVACTTAAVYSAGYGVNEPKPPIQTHTEASRRYRAKPPKTESLGIVPGALRYQRQGFALAGVWA